MSSELDSLMGCRRCREENADDVGFILLTKYAIKSLFTRDWLGSRLSAFFFHGVKFFVPRRFYR